MHYRHSFHAGNFADVFKHGVLSLLLGALRKKPGAFCYLETHAGAGLYDLRGADARKTGEWRGGIGRLWRERAAVPELADYFAIVRALNPTLVDDVDLLRYYPGSPLIAKALRRDQDRLVFMETHPGAHAALQTCFAKQRHVAIHAQDGYQGLMACLPPTEARGLVLIDPPFEDAAEFTQALAGLRSAQMRWPTACHALWYPIKDRAPSQRLQRALVESGVRRILCAELCVLPDDVALRLNGCGLILINPPWQIDTALATLLPRLFEVLRVEGAGRARVEWLVPE